MFRAFRVLPTSLLLVFAVFANPAWATPQEAPTRLVWHQLGELPVDAAAGPDEAHIKRRALLDFDLEVLARPIGKRVVDLELFDGKLLSVELTARGSARPGSARWFGSWDEGRSSLTIAVQGDALAATLRDGDDLYRVLPVGAGRSRLELTGEFQLPGCEVHTAPGEGPGANAAEDGAGEQRRPQAGSSSTPIPIMSTFSSIDVLVAYTPQVKDASGGTNGTLALIDLAMSETNESYLNSGAGCVVRLVHTHEVSYTESGNNSTDLTRLWLPNDGFMDEVHDLRTQFGADAVSLLINSGNNCGSGFLMTVVSSAFQANAFSVTQRVCATGNLTFGHELGHNFGCAHNREDATVSSKPYAFGYRSPGNQFRTVMALAPGQRVPVFSSPNAQWDGVTMGTPTEDNSRALTENGPTIAGWAPTQIPIIDCNGNGVDDSLEISIGLSPDQDGDGVPDDCLNFFGDITQVSLIDGGVQNLFIQAGDDHAGETFVMLGSLSGTSPGVPFGDLTVPLVVDAYTTSLLAAPSGSLLSPVIGVLDADGKGGSSFTVPGSILPLSLLATPVNHTFLTLTASGEPGIVGAPVQLLFTFL